MANIFFLPSQVEFLRKFPQNDAITQRVIDLWQQFDTISIWLLIVTILIGISSALYYYIPYNNRPGRHYKAKYWGIFMVYSCITTLVLTLFFEYLIISTSLPFFKIFGVYLQVAFINAVYTFFMYIITSFIICNWGKTNANRIFKIKKS